MFARLKRIHSCSPLRKRDSLLCVFKVSSWYGHLRSSWVSMTFYCGPVSSQFMFSSQPDNCLLLCLPAFSTIFSTETLSSLLVGSKYWFGILSMQKEWKNFHQRPLKHFPIDIFLGRVESCIEDDKAKTSWNPWGVYWDCCCDLCDTFSSLSSIFLIHI